MRPYRGSDGWISVGYPYAPCPTGPRSTAQKSSKGQLMLCRKLSDKNRKEWNFFLFLPSIFIYGFRYRPHRKKLFRLDEASGMRNPPLLHGDQQHAVVHSHSGSGAAW